MGRNGAQHTTEAQGRDGKLGGVGHVYDFTPGSVNNVLANEFIHEHSDIPGLQVAYAAFAPTAAE